VFNYRNPVYGATITRSTIVPTTKEELRRTEAFVQDEISFWRDRISLIGGLRYHDTMETSGNQLPSFSGTATLAKGDATVGRYGIVLRPIQNVTLYGSHEEAFRYKSGVDYLGRPRTPAVGTNKEIGIKTLFLNGAFGVNVSYFDLTLDRETINIIQGPNDPMPGQLGSVEGGVQTNKCFDVSFSASKSFSNGGLNLVGSLYMGDMKNAANQKPAGATNNTASLAASYGFTRGALQGFKFGAAYVFQGERVGPTFQDGFIPHFDSYETVRAFVAYSTKRFRYQVNVDNVFDKEYVDGFEFVTWIYPSAGRTFKFTVGYNF
jgi:iron complex outermembrane receptor protein